MLREVRARLSKRHLALAGIFAGVLAAMPIVFADPVSQVSLTNVDSPDPVASGAQLTYTITAVNTGGSSVSNAVLTDQLNGVGGIGVPPQFVISSSRGSCTQTVSKVTCSAGTIEGGGSWVVTVRGVVTASVGTTLNNTASVSFNKSSQNFTSTSTATTLVGSGGGSSLPDLTIAKDGPASVPVSAPMTYTLTVNNLGTANASGVKVVDTLPSGLSGVSFVTTSLFVCTSDEPPLPHAPAVITVTCLGGAVNAGANATIAINATSPATAGAITNTAVVDPDNTIAESNELNNTSALVNTQVGTAPPPVPLSIVKTDVPLPGAAWSNGAGPDPVTPGQTLTYKILVTNNASTRANDVTMVDGTQSLNASSVTIDQVVTNGTVGTGGGCTINAPQVNCLARTLNPGGTIVYTVTGQVVGTAGSTIINTATVSGNIKNVSYSSTSTVTTTVRPNIDLTITNAVAPNPVCASSFPTTAQGGAVPAPTSPPLLGPPPCLGGLTYTLVIGNSGINDANNVLVRDNLPAGVKFDHVSGDLASFPGGCALSGGSILNCSGGTIPAASTRTLIISAAAPSSIGSIVNVATVDPNNAIFESDETNNTASVTSSVVTGVDLTIVKFDSPPDSPAGFDPIATSGTETYVIKVEDIGPQSVANIRVRDTLPANTIFRSAQGDHGFTCGYASGVVECIGGSLPGTFDEFYSETPTGDQKATITIKVFAQPIVGTMHNEVRVDPLNEIPEINEGNNIAFQDTTVVSGGASQGAFNELTISKIQQSPDPTNTARNAPVTYIIKVGNDGTDPVTGVKVRDTLPAGARYIEATGTNSFLCSQAGANVVDCVGGQIPANTPTASGATITLKAFAPDTPGTYTNQVEVDPDHVIPEGNEFNNNASATTVVKNGGAGAFYDLSVVKTQTPANPVARNSVVTFAIVVSNTGSDTVNGVTVRDTPPAGSRFISATAPIATQFTCSPSGADILCTNGQIAGGGTATITVVMFAPDPPGSYTNQVTVDPNNTIPEGDELNNSYSINTVVQNCTTGACTPFNDLQISITGPATITPGGEIDYTVKVWNVGTDPALNVTVRDILPVGLTFVSATDGGGTGGPFTCGAVGAVVNCTGATINGNTTATTGREIDIVAKAPNQVIDVVDEVVVDPDNTIPEGDELNNTATTPTSVVSQIDLTVTKSGPSVASQSSVADYEIKVKNNKVNGNGQNAFGVVMHDPLPVGLIPLAVDAGTGNNWACQVQGDPINVVDCLGDLTPDQEVTIKITVFQTAESGRSLDNTACVDPANTITESNETNNCSEFSSAFGDQPKLSPDIQVSKSVNKSTANPGDSDLEYTITVSNVGTAKAKTGLSVEDDMPPDAVFVNATATNSWTCTQAAPITCSDGGSGLDVGESTTITIHATIKPSATAPLINTAKVVSLVKFDPAGSQCSPDPSQCENETADHKGNNTSTATTSVGGSGFDFVISSIVDAPDPVNKGDALTYTVVALNAGTSDTPAGQPVHIRLDIPPSTAATFVGADGTNGFTCGAPVSDAVDCSGDMPAGGTTVITLKMAVVSSPPPTLTLVATIDPANDFVEQNEGNNQLTQVTTVSNDVCAPGCVDLVASQLLPSVDPVDTGKDLTVTFTVVNTGDTAADFGTPDSPADPKVNPLLWFDLNADGPISLLSRTSSNPAVSCIDDVPPGPTFVHSDCAVDHNGATAGGTKLNPGEGVTITIKVHVSGGTKITATGTADPLNLVTEFLETNNGLTRIIVIKP